MKGISVFMIALLAAVLVSGCTSSPAGDPSDGEGNGGGTATVTYTLSEVSQHDTAEDCWMVLDGKVYDFTPFISQGIHPGGAAILEGCGKDGTDLFETRPMGSGTPHSQGARDLHPQYLIGDLA